MLREIGRELNVRYVLEGSVQRGGDRMRVNVQLIDAETGNHLWAERFDKPVGRPLDTQDEIVARACECARSGARRRPRLSDRERAPNSDAMDFYLQAWASWYKGFTPEQPRSSASIVRARLSARSLERVGRSSPSPL